MKDNSFKLVDHFNLCPDRGGENLVGTRIVIQRIFFAKSQQVRLNRRSLLCFDLF